MDKIGINLNRVCKDYGIRALSYQDAPALAGAFMPDRRGSSAGFAVKQKGGPPIILFDGERPRQEGHFTVAHELGHVLLGHLDYRRDAAGNYPDFAEIEANCFAAVLMAYEIIAKYGREVSA